MSKVLHLVKENPNEGEITMEQIKNNTDRPYLLKFGAEWCGPCQSMKPELEQVAELKAADNIKVVDIDVDKCSDVAAEYRIMSVPTLVIQKGDSYETISIGMKTHKEIIEILNEKID